VSGSGTGKLKLVETMWPFSELPPPDWPEITMIVILSVALTLTFKTVRVVILMANLIFRWLLASAQIDQLSRFLSKSTH
jgi:hypothetical protein